MKTDPVRKAKTVYSELATSRASATVTCVLADSKAGRGVGKLYRGRIRRLQVCPGWSCGHGAAGGGPTRSGEILRDACLASSGWCYFGNQDKN